MTERLPDNIGWKFWKAALKGKKVDVPLGVVAIGFYRKYAHKRDIWWPLAIFVADHNDPHSPKYYQFADAPPVLLETKEEELDFDYRTFADAQKTPVTFEEYEYWKANREWPISMGIHAPKKDHKPEFTDLSQVTSELGADPLNEREVIGNNSGATAEEIEKLTLEVLQDQVDSAVKLASEIGKIDTQDKANKAQGARSRLTELAGLGDKERSALVAPFLKGQRDINNSWNPVIDRAKTKASELKRGMDVHAASEKARIKAEREAAIAAAVQTGDVPMDKPEEVVFVGAQGRKSTTKEVVDHEIEDWDLVYQQLRENKEVRALLDHLVAKVKLAGGKMKGVKYTPRIVVT